MAAEERNSAQKGEGKRDITHRNSPQNRERTTQGRDAYTVFWTYNKAGATRSTATLLATTKIYMIIFELKKLRENFDEN